ncbi:glycine--tRNA ligase subunit beta [Actibacterium sp. 188UL27-1]|uniref:glycine--tRNA ligase subunit beta n=1 Tax=Actibacterium sp. 188UL27-1 TaxID=2786961 RepID=UPI001958658A|nr:glycine--tRNA ligase subunit beta [Actibacterium sp. 188UL27-1]MBM7068756.1 glycine--tRNA ligase subunit beta [Actibacterium sp. 188UL27-1]
MPDLLIELFSEEIPARMQAKASDDLRRLVTDGLVEAGLTYASAAAFATPRRLALTVEGLLAQSPAVQEERKGPRTDAPEKAVEGFLRSAGLTADQLERRADKKGEVFFAVINRPGRDAAEIVAEVLAEVIRKFPWPKSMRWGTGSLRWVRPLQSVLCILSDDGGHAVVPMEVEGFVAGDTTEGHRFMVPGRFAVTGFEDYAAKLKRAFVVLDPAERAEAIWHDATQLAFAQGLELVKDKGLLHEVAGLVEWPVVLMGEINKDFLGLPAEVLQTSMKEHQKFFSVRDPKSGQIVRFVTVANRETADNGATILAGNQKVLSARLADAKFFWQNDLRVAAEAKMEPWLDSLANVTFHNKLGSEKERIDRITALSREIAPIVGADADLAEQAARVAKADLASEMVYEFPELQGVMGRYYSDAAGLPSEVALACAEHRSPLGPSDEVPTAPTSVAVALADKIDTLTGFWTIGEKPTGSKDPFALRRAALGVIRLVLSNDQRLSLLDLVAKGLAGDDDLGISRDLLSFFHDRLKVYLRDDGIRHDVIDACLAMPGSDDLTLLAMRARAVASFLQTDDGKNLVQGFKRANNILRQAEEADGVAYEYGPDRKFAEDPAEIALFDALDLADGAISSAIEAEDFASAMGIMASLRQPIDAFFEAVQVNAENAVVRRNRLNLLHRIRTVCTQVADIGQLEG